MRLKIKYPNFHLLKVDMVKEPEVMEEAAEEDTVEIVQDRVMEVAAAAVDTIIMQMVHHRT